MDTKQTVRADDFTVFFVFVFFGFCFVFCFCFLFFVFFCFFVTYCTKHEVQFCAPLVSKYVRTLLSYLALYVPSASADMLICSRVA